MTTYVVTSKATGSEIYRYNADAPIEWSGMGFANHAPEAVDPSIPVDVPVKAMTWTKLEYLCSDDPDITAALAMLES